MVNQIVVRIAAERIMTSGLNPKTEKTKKLMSLMTSQIRITDKP